MNSKKVVFLITVFILLILFTHSIYAPMTIENFNAVNLQNINQIKENIKDKKFSFAVVGNIENSTSIFDKRILPVLKSNSADFIISTGNNVRDGNEGKYRVFYRTLQKMNIPFVTGVGQKEIGDEGFKNFYKYFGPFYFSFAAADSYFIFLDTTGHTPDNWQQSWLEDELKTAVSFENIFVIMNKAPFKVETESLLDDKEKFIEPDSKREFYQSLFSEYNVDAVFSSNADVFSRKNINGVSYIITGGAGGELILENDSSFYHYIEVEVDQAGVDIEVKKLENNPGIIAKIAVNIWVAVQSFIYTNYINIIIAALIIFMVGYIIYREMTREIDYYRNFSYSEEVDEDRKLKIAMFTNNYFPVIGGVPISIERLSRSLRNLGHEVKIFAPQYPDYDREKENIIRCSLLYYYKQDGMDIPITNIFSRKIENEFYKNDFDIVHCHHPFWLGSKGMSLGHKYNVPVVFTYHTRLEKYAHYIPGFLFLRRLFANRFAHLMIRHFSNRANAVFAPTDSTQEYLRAIGVKRFIKVIPTGVDFDNYSIDEGSISKLRSKLADEEILLITVARLSKEKNLYFLLDGIKYVKKNSDLNFKLIVLGDGPERDNLQDYIKENNLENNVELLGSIDFEEISRYYLASDLFVFASTSETQGMVLLEAMAGKTPVVAVRSSGTDDVIKNGYNGYKTEEDVKSWAEKVIKLMKDDELLAKTSENALKMAQKYSIMNMGKEAEKVYKKLLK